MNAALDKEISELCNEFAQRLIAQNKTLAIAESCTGGWLAKVLTDLPGSSGWFLGGVVSYSNKAKQNLLDVDEACINEFGAVSQQVVEQMANGACNAFSSSYSLAVTGIAGPTGGTKSKPVGLVWFAVKGTFSEVKSVRKVFSGDREEVRQQAVLMALKLLIEKSA